MFKGFQSTKEWIEQEMKEMYESLVNPEKRAEAKRKTEREARIEMKKSDAGL